MHPSLLCFVSALVALILTAHDATAGDEPVILPDELVLARKLLLELVGYSEAQHSRPSAANAYDTTAVPMGQLRAFIRQIGTD